MNRGLDLIEGARDEALGQISGAVSAELGAKLDSKAEISYVDTSVPPVMPAVNLWDDSAWENATMAPNGVVTPHEKNRLSSHIPVTPSMTYSSRSAGLHRIIWFNSSGTAITGTDTAWQPGGTHVIWTSPVGAVTARLVIAPDDLAGADTIFNRGAVLFDPARPSSGYWEGRELPPVDADGVAAVARAEVDSLRDESGKIAATNIDGAVPPIQYPVNNFDPTTATFETMAPNGTVTEHASHRLTPFLPVNAGASYLGWSETIYRVAFFNQAQAAISGTDTSWQAAGASAKLWTAPTGAVSARMVVGSGSGQTHQAWFGPSNTVFEPLAPPASLPTGFWDDRELPPIPDGGVSEEQLTVLRQDILAEADQRYPVSHFEPSIPTLTFATEYTGWAQPFWLTTDGAMIYGGRGPILEQSTDEWSAQQVVHEFPKSIGGVRELADGELLVSTIRDNADSTKAKLYKSSGYDRANPTAATWTEVLEAGAANANINNAWGLQVHQNIVVAAEYGLRDVEGSRRVWLSEDHGDTWTLVFDQMTTVAPGRPVWTETAHLHGAAWDPYWNRLWVICGDNPNTATYYSDDKGQSWTFVTGSEEVQYTGIMPLPDVVLFGSDRAPNGLHVYRRGLKSDMPTIRTLFEVNAHPSLTQVWQLPYKQDWSPSMPVYFPADPAGDGWPSVLTATIDGRKGHLLWEGEPQGSGLPVSGRVVTALGPTAQGNVIMVMHSDPTVTGYRVMKAPAPEWTRA